MIATLKKWFGAQTLVVEVDPLQKLAKRLVTRMNENWPDTDGEFKRAQVYAQLVNTFPERSKRDVSRAIEDAL